MFSADLISPNDLYRLALRDPTMLNFDLTGFKFINIKPEEFKPIATQVTQERLNFLYSWHISLMRHKIPNIARSKVAEFLGAKHYGPFKISV